MIPESRNFEPLSITLVLSFDGSLPDISSSFRFDNMKSGNATVYLLREQFEKFPSAPQKLDVCESIAHCLFQLEQYQDAAGWYETAGRLILASNTTPPQLKAMSALDEYESALECYRKDKDDERFEECSTLIGQLRRACASA